MDETQRYSVAEMERMMKVQDVLLKAMARKITWWAAEILSVTDRTMRRWREKLEKDGYAGWRIGAREPEQRAQLATPHCVFHLAVERSPETTHIDGGRLVAGITEKPSWVAFLLSKEICCWRSST